MNYKIHVPEEASQKRQWRQDRKKINKEKTTKTIPKRDKTNKIELATQLLHANKAINVHLQSQIQNNSKTTTNTQRKTSNYQINTIFDNGECKKQIKIKQQTKGCVINELITN